MVCAVRRPAGLSPGLTIHLLEDGVYVTAAHSRVFLGWSADEIHTALNEAAMSVETSRVLLRVGRALGARSGTGPDDTPWLRMERQESRAEGRTEGERALLVRQAARRFGAGAAERLATRLLRIEGPGSLDTVSDGIVDCATGAELIDRVEGLDSHA